MQRIKTIDTVEQEGKEVLIKGWVNARRNMGKIVFLDVRDRWGRCRW
jgi:aspartyl-tRNA synthetase